MIIFSRAWIALMRRNMIYRKRGWIGTVCTMLQLCMHALLIWFGLSHLLFLCIQLLEVALPVGCIALLLLIKLSVSSSGGLEAKIVPAEFPNATNIMTPLSFADYVHAMETRRVCEWNADEGYFGISGLPEFATNWQVPFLKCDAVRCEEEGQDATPFCQYHILAIAGEASRAKAMKDYLLENYPALDTASNDRIPVNYALVQIMESSEAIDAYVESSNYGKSSSPKVAMGVVWNGNGGSSSYRYSLRQNATNFNNPHGMGQIGTITSPDTAKLFDNYAKKDAACAVDDGPDQGPLQESCTGLYIYNGILTMQRMVNDFILYDSNTTERVTDVSFLPMPTREYTEEGFYATTATFAPLLIVLGLLYPVAAMIGYMTREKELRQKELMKMMSVTEANINWAWFVTFASLHLVTATLVTVVTIELYGGYSKNELAILWEFWIFVFTSTITFSMAVSSLASKATRGVLFGLLLFFVGYFVTSSVDYESRSLDILTLVSLHPVAALSYGLQEIGRLGDIGAGVTYDSYDTTDNPSGYTLRTAMDLLAVDTVLWGILTWYLNRVIRPDYGQALPPWFPFTKAYWFPHSASTAAALSTVEDADCNPESVPLEPVGKSLQSQSDAGQNIIIRGLTKVFGDHKAVDNLNLTMYNGQITALLGHNGAGKTTTIGMLTGAIGATEGTATVMGQDIRTQMSSIRHDVGICLQHDCLFPQLTVREHIQFFSRLKGLYKDMSYQEAEEHVDQAIRDVALFEKRNTFSKNLSGGMKRKLSVAMAFCGGSKVVLLDEPTSGMDPFSRRFTWNVIRQNRRDRCIILTTHFMDEADILGDRIAIMAEGQLRCAGSSLFLKKEYGVGYQLTIEKSKDRNVDESLKDVIQSAVPESSLLSNVGSELSFQLPLGAAAQFGPMFTELDRGVDNGSIISYGVSITTLDEVFLLVARGGHHEANNSLTPATNLAAHDIETGKEDSPSVTNATHASMDLEQQGVFFRHVAALLRKRAAFFRRDKKAWICTTVLPCIFVLFGFLMFKLMPDDKIDGMTFDLREYNGLNNPTPIAFNSPSQSFVCQGQGNCTNLASFDQDAVSGAKHYYCGTDRVVRGDCTLSITDKVMGQMSERDGVHPVAIDASDLNKTGYVLTETASQHSGSQYGAIFFTHDSSSVVNGATSYADTVESQCSQVANESECQNTAGVGYVIQYNFTAFHISPTLQTLADQALARYSLNDPDFVIETSIDPLPFTKRERNVGKEDDAFPAWFLVILSFPFIGGVFGAFIVQERESKAKHLQTVAGVNPAAYWLSSFIWDVFNYMFPFVMVLILMFAFDVSVLTTSKNQVFPGVVITLFLYGPASAGFSYCVSFAFKSPSLCTIVLIISGFLVGMGGPMTTLLLSLLGYSPTNPMESLQIAADIVPWCLRFIPSFCLGNSLMNAIYLKTIQLIIYNDPTLKALDLKIMGYDIIMLALQTVGYLLLAIALDVGSTNPTVMKAWKRFWSIITLGLLSPRQLDAPMKVLPDDDDVMAEQERVLTGGANDDLIVLDQLTKRYDNGKVAVNEFSLGIRPGECFGLLGINGAGKTTTMGMLTAEFPPTEGDATLAGYSVSREPSQTRKRIGYCPQFDAHFANLTGREHVELYASIKGVPRASIQEASAFKLSEVGLAEEDWDRLSAGYSGGMKRRLSLACATIGQPQIVFLDECSTGVDPVARREIWQLVSDMVSNENVPYKDRTSVILTTHSMEECEALCPRIGIMANGRLRCLGSAQHLKNKFGQGYQIELKLDSVNKDDEDYATNLASIANISRKPVNATLSLESACHALHILADGTNVLSKLVADGDNPVGYGIWREASSTEGVSLETLASFATLELRMRAVESFVSARFVNPVLRERQDTKARYEVGSMTSSGKKIRISSVFAELESNKDTLRLSDYGVSQTSLEQVFNVHAAEAERLKQGRNDK